MGSIPDSGRCHRATDPMSHNYCASVLMPGSHTYWGPSALEPVLHNGRSYRDEKPTHHGWRVVSAPRDSRKAPAATKTPHSQNEINKIIWKSKVICSLYRFTDISQAQNFFDSFRSFFFKLIFIRVYLLYRLPWWPSGKQSACSAGDHLQYRGRGFDPWVRSILWRRQCVSYDCTAKWISFE